MLLDIGAETLSFRNVLIRGSPSPKPSRPPSPQPNSWRFEPKALGAAKVPALPSFLLNAKLTDAADLHSVQPRVRQTFFD
jgi:hypothetical protein